MRKLLHVSQRLTVLLCEQTGEHDFNTLTTRMRPPGSCDCVAIKSRIMVASCSLGHHCANSATPSMVMVEMSIWVHSRHTKRAKRLSCHKGWPLTLRMASRISGYVILILASMTDKLVVFLPSTMDTATCSRAQSASSWPPTKHNSCLPWPSPSLRASSGFWSPLLSWRTGPPVR